MKVKLREFHSCSACQTDTCSDVMNKWIHVHFLPSAGKHLFPFSQLMTHLMPQFFSFLLRHGVPADALRRKKETCSHFIIVNEAGGGETRLFVICLPGKQSIFLYQNNHGSAICFISIIYSLSCAQLDRRRQDGDLPGDECIRTECFQILRT